MITVTGIIEDSEGRPLCRLVTFESISTPTDEGGGIITANTTLKIQSLPDGTFSIQLRPGNYNVIYGTLPRPTTFQIAIQTAMDGETRSIDELIVSTFAALPGQAPFTVWNGETPFNLIFQPLPQPPNPTLSFVPYIGSHITAGETYQYAITYVTSDGETELSGRVPMTPGAPPGNQAIRVNWGTSAPSGVIHTRVWRNTHSGTPDEFSLLAELSPATTFYDDWESMANFLARANVNPAPPKYNSTAGQVWGAEGDLFGAMFSFSRQGMFALRDIEFTAGKGVVGVSANGTRWRLTFEDDGGITTTAI